MSEWDEFSDPVETTAAAEPAATDWDAISTPAENTDDWGSAATKWGPNIASRWKGQVGGMMEKIGDRDAALVEQIAKAGDEDRNWFQRQADKIDAVVSLAGRVPEMLLRADPETNEKIVDANKAIKEKGGELYDEAHKELQANQVNPGDNEMLRYTSMAVESGVGSMAPALMATGLTKNPNVGLSLMGTQVYGEKYAEMRRRGRDYGEASTDAMVYALSEAVTEKVPLDVLLKPGTKFISRVFKGGLAEGGQEMINEAIQMAYDAGALDDIPRDENGNVDVSQVLKRIADAGIVGSMIGTGSAVVTHPFVKNGSEQSTEAPQSPENAAPETVSGERPTDTGDNLQDGINELLNEADRPVETADDVSQALDSFSQRVAEQSNVPLLPSPSNMGHAPINAEGHVSGPGGIGGPGIDRPSYWGTAADAEYDAFSDPVTPDQESPSSPIESQSFAISERENGGLLVQGDKAAIRQQLAEAGVEATGLASKNGVIFGKQLAPAVRRALEGEASASNAGPGQAPATGQAPAVATTENTPISSVESVQGGALTQEDVNAPPVQAVQDRPPGSGLGESNTPVTTPGQQVPQAAAPSPEPAPADQPIPSAPQGQSAPVAVDIQERPNGSILVKGDRKAIRQRLAEAGVKETGFPVKEGMTYKKESATKVREALEGGRRVQDKPVDVERRTGEERRSNNAARDYYDSLTREQLVDELMKHELTGIKGRRAFVREHADAGSIISIDADSLKWINDNMSPEAGDRLLQAVADAIVEEFGFDYAYHISGDEFYVVDDGLLTTEELNAAMTRVQKSLDQAIIKETKADGTVITKKGLAATHGIGKDRSSADAALKREKVAREQRGERAGRGETPPGVSRELPGVPAATGTGEQTGGDATTARPRPDDGQTDSRAAPESETVTEPTPTETPAPAGVSASGAVKESLTAQDEKKASAILDRANVTGKDRLDVMRDFRDGKYSLEDLEKAYPVSETRQESDTKAEPVSKVADKEDGAQQKIEDLGEKIGGARKDTAAKTGPRGAKTESKKPAWEKRFLPMQNLLQGKDGKWNIVDTKSGRPMRGSGFSLLEFETEEEAQAFVPIVAVAVKHAAVPVRDGDGYQIIRNVSDRKRVKVVNKVFEDREEAMRYMAEHAVEIMETKTSFGEEILPTPEKVYRTGKERRKGNVDGQDFMDTFGFRGVEFGNWNNQAERQEVMNHAYDALMDLAEVMNVPPKALALDGELALAFGARGQGMYSGKAHYDTRYGVINLTKMSGAGSLAHEWFHAADHYFGRQDGKAKSERITNDKGNKVFDTKGAKDMASHGFRRINSGVREEVRSAYKDLIQSMYRKAEQYVEDTKRADDFVARSREELRKTLDRIREDIAQQRDPEIWKRYNKPATAEQLAEFDALSATLIDGQDLDTEYRLNNPNSKSRSPGAFAGRQSNDTLDAISDIYKKVRGRTGFAKDYSGVLDRVRAEMGNYAQRIEMLEQAQSGEKKTKHVPTSFAMEAREADQGRASDYWTTEHEMAARAFAAYVEDKIAEQGGNSSQFLVYHAHGAVLAPTDKGYFYPYPEGEERKAVNKAFDNLVSTLKTRETDRGVALFSRKITDDDVFRSGTAPTTSMSVAGVEKAVADVILTWGDNAPVVEVVKAESGLPAHIRRQIAAFDDNTGVVAKGVLDPATRTVYLVADGLESKRDALTILAHESVGHYGMEEMLGPDQFQQLVKRVQWMKKAGNKKVHALADQVEEFYGQTDPTTEAKEIIALMAEQQQMQSVFGKTMKGIRQAVRQFLRKLGFKVMFSTGDIDAMLSRAGKYLRQSGGKSRQIGGVLHHKNLGEIAVEMGKDGQYGAGKFARENPEIAANLAAEVAGSKVVQRDSETATLQSEDATFHLIKEGGRWVLTDVDAANFARKPGDVTKTEAFKRWFDDSKVVDEYGKPSIVYHGSHAENIDSFSGSLTPVPNPGDGMNWTGEQEIIYFTDSKKAAKTYGKNITTAYLSLKNPLEVDAKGGKYGQDVIPASYVAEAVENGNDGVIIRNVVDVAHGKGDPATTYIAFRPTQIKSATGNSGEFDSADSRINFARKKAPEKSAFNLTGTLKRRADQLADLFDKFRYEAQDKHIYLKKMQEAIGNVTEETDAYGKEELYHGRVRYQMDQFHEDMVKPMLELISMSGKPLAEVEQYLHARHAEEANAALREINDPGREGYDALSGMTDEEAQRILKENEGDRVMRAIGIAADRIGDFQLTVLEQNGLESPEFVEAVRQKYKHYVPLHREQEPFTVGPAGPGKGSGYNTARKFLRGRTGSTSEVEDILPNLIAQAESTIINAEKAKVHRAIYKMAEENPDPDFWELDTTKSRYTVDKNGRMIKTTSPFDKDAENALRVRIGGEDRVIRFNGQNEHAMRMVAALRNMDQAQVGLMIRMGLTLNRYLSAINTGFNPEFIISNAARDIQTAVYNLSSTKADGIAKRMVKDWPKAFAGIRSALRKNGEHPWSKHFEEFREAGAMTGWLEHTQTVEDFRKKLDRDISDLGGSRKAKIKRGIRKGLDLVEDYNMVVENAVRLSAFVNAREAGISTADAARMAKNLTVNFNRRGNKGVILNGMYLFYNASIQGSARLLQTVATSKKGRKLAAGTIAFAVMMDLLNRSMGDDDDGVPYYDKIDDTMKERNLIFMDPFSDDGDYYKFPLPWGYNVFHVIGQKTGKGLYAATYPDSPTAKRTGLNDLSDILVATANAFNPVSGGTFMQTVSPTVLDPLAQLAENKTWTGNDLMPEDIFGQVTPDSQKAWRTTPQVFKDIAEGLNEVSGGNAARSGAIDVSPETLQMAWDTGTGGLGRFFTGIIDTAQKAVDSDLKLEPRETPLLRKVVGAQNQYADQELFYQRAADVQTFKEEMDLFRGKPEFKELMGERGDLFKMTGMLKMTQRRLKVLRKRYQRALEQGDEKQMQELKKSMWDAYKTFNKRYDKVVD